MCLNEAKKEVETKEKNNNKFLMLNHFLWFSDSIGEIQKLRQELHKILRASRASKNVCQIEATLRKQSLEFESFRCLENNHNNANFLGHFSEERVG